jgi:hypothetical protein
VTPWQVFVLALGVLGATSAAWLIAHSDARSRVERWWLVGAASTQCLTLVTLVVLAGDR